MSFNWVFILIFIELIFVGWIDFKTHKISNRWVFLNIGLSIVFHLFIQHLYPLSWEVLIFPIGFIGIGFFLFLLNIMGAGDSKFLASLFLIVPLEFHMPFFEKILVSTLINGSILILAKTLFHRRTLYAYFISRYWNGIKEIIRSRISYAPVIVLAWLLLGIELWT